MEIVNITKARSDFFNLIDDVILGAPKCISTRKGNAIVVSQSDWEGLQETLYLMSDKKLHEELKDRMKTPNCECVEDLDW
ncbi:MAG: type II toxin-antitoxin system Phd/YefM family antitoxin [Lachnospiraceae bacterium]|nr:type II toxin-antitoxin system Phd/YefM family antitoxin [Lachnospiraceae bacterium]